MKEAEFIRRYVRKFFQEQIDKFKAGLIHKIPDGRHAEGWVVSPKPSDLIIDWPVGRVLSVTVCAGRHDPNVIRDYKTGHGLVEAKVILGLTISIDGEYMRPAQKKGLANVSKCGHMALVAVRFEFKATKKEKKGTFHKYIEYSELERCGSISFNRDGSVK